MTRLYEQVRYDGLEWTDGNGDTHPCLGGSSGSNLPGGGDEDGFGHDNRTDNGWKDRWPVVEAPLYRTDPITGKYILTDRGDGSAPTSGGKEVIGTRGRRYKIGDASKGTLLGATKAAHIIQNSAQAMDKCASHIIKTDADLVAAGMNPDRETTTCHVCEPGRFTTVSGPASPSDSAHASLSQQCFPTRSLYHPNQPRAQPPHDLHCLRERRTSRRA